MKTFHVEIIKPSHYDKDGYVIQWWKAWIPSNSMACLYAIARDCAERRVLGEDVAIEVDAFDEMNVKLPIERIVARVKQPGHDGLVCLAGVQSNQFPRAMAIARRFRAQGVAVAIGGFHISGCLAMLKDLTPELREALDLGVILFAGEAEEHFAGVLADVHAGAAKPIYNFMDDLPNMQKQPIPELPLRLVKRYDGVMSSFDAGRGCPFQCSFCTIINVQGRKSRWRDADDIERILRQNAKQGISRFFITDDNFARNKNWEAIFDRMIEMRDREGFCFHFLIQVDTLAHKIPNFIHKAARAGCKYAFIGLESINPDNLAQMNKGQNRITEYRKMFQAWKQAGAVTYAGYILGLPGDTPQSVRRDIEIVQKELPVDLLEFTMLTPLPGSEDHKALYEQNVWMERDLNAYDLETVTVAHPRMSREEWQRVYADAWNWYYTDEHVERLLRRNAAYGVKTLRVWRSLAQIYGAANFEGVHPQQCGYFRRKDRAERRPELPREPALGFYAAHSWRSLVKYARFALYALKTWRIRKRVDNDPASRSYSDLAIAAVVDAEGEALEMFELNPSSRTAVEKARRQARRRRHRENAIPAP
ncbi:MAG: B12-binding domain-containing radical SAM protein [Roseiarcus sp.]